MKERTKFPTMEETLARTREQRIINYNKVLEDIEKKIEYAIEGGNFDISIENYLLSQKVKDFLTDKGYTMADNFVGHYIIISWKPDNAEKL